MTRESTQEYVIETNNLSVRFDICPACNTPRKPNKQLGKEIISDELTFTQAEAINSHQPNEAVVS